MGLLLSLSVSTLTLVFMRLDLSLATDKALSVALHRISRVQVSDVQDTLK